jgi:hypothetical protein
MKILFYDRKIKKIKKKTKLKGGYLTLSNVLMSNKRADSSADYFFGSSWDLMIILFQNLFEIQSRLFN